MRGKFLRLIALAALLALALAVEETKQEKKEDKDDKDKPKPKLQIHDPQVGAEFAKDQEVVISLQGDGFPEKDRHCELLLDKKKVRDVPLPKVDGSVFNITLTGVKKGKHEFDIVLYYDKDVLDVWGTHFFVGSETARIRTKLLEGRDKAGSRKEAVDSYLAFVLNKGGDAEKIRAGDDGFGGVGLFAKEDFERGDVIAEIPFIATLGPETAMKSQWADFLLMLYQDKDLPGQFASAIHLLIAADEDGSVLEPMIRTLPLHEELNVGMSWDRHDNMRAVNMVPQLAKLGHDIQEFFDRGYERFWAVLDMKEKEVKQLKKKKKLPNYTLFTRGNLLWAVSVLMTRGVDLPAEPPINLPNFLAPAQGLYRIIPTSDVLNMHPDAYSPYPPPPEGVPAADGRLIVSFNNTGGYAKAIASGDIPAGAQIYVGAPEIENLDLLVQFGYIMRPNLFDISLAFPEWVTGKLIPHPRTPRCARLSQVAPGSQAVVFADVLNMTIKKDGELGLKQAMDELFDAAIVHVPIDDKDVEDIAGTCKAEEEDCNKGSQLIRDVTYTAVSSGTIIGEGVPEVAAAWKEIRKYVEAPLEVKDDLPAAPGK